MSNKNYAKKFYQTHKEELKIERNKYHKTNHSKYSILKSKAKSRGIECTLSFEKYCDVVSLGFCDFCKGPLPKVGAGVDRINSNIGYVEGNVRPCCTFCNQAKSTMSDSEFKEWILRVYNNFINHASF